MELAKSTEYKENRGKATSAFHGYAPPTSSTTYTPNQFFDVVLPHASRGCLRLVAYLIRKTLGWSDAEGNPQNPEAYVSYRELIETAGVSRGAIKDAIQEALDKRYISCLRLGQPHRANEEGFSALYTLKWDEREQYVTDSDEFDGFYAGNGNLTHIPNDFFDYTIPNEPLAVVQVIGVIIRNTIGWQTKYGMRRQKIEMSFSEIMRRTGIGSRTTISKALTAAIDGYHIRRVERGVFDPHAGADSKATVYAIRWQDEDRPDPKKNDEQPLLFDLDEGDGSKSGPAPSGSKPTSRTTVQNMDRSSTVQNVDRGLGSKSGPANGTEAGPATVQNMDSNGFKKRTDIKTTNLNNLPKQQQTDPPVVEGGHSLSLLLRKLIAEGIEPLVAKRLVESFPHKQIERQLEWLPLRDIKTSRTGFLIRAIERDMPKPGALPSERKLSEEEAFVEGFYEGWNGSNTKALVPASPSEVPTAQRLLASVRVQIPDIDSREAGRRFGKYAQSRESGEKKPIASFIVQARNHGFAYVDGLAEKLRSEKLTEYKKAREEHEAAHKDAYEGFLVELESQLAQANPAAFAEFTEWEAQSRDKIEKRSNFGGERITARRLEFFDSPQAGRDRFLEFFSARPDITVPTFWDWDAEMNPNRFNQEKPQ